MNTPFTRLPLFANARARNTGRLVWTSHKYQTRIGLCDFRYCTWPKYQILPHSIWQQTFVFAFLCSCSKGARAFCAVRVFSPCAHSFVLRFPTPIPLPQCGIKCCLQKLALDCSHRSYLSGLALREAMPPWSNIAHFCLYSSDSIVYSCT